MACVRINESTWATEYNENVYKQIKLETERVQDSGLSIRSFIQLPANHRLDAYRSFWAGMDIGSHGWEPRDWRRLDERHAHRELEDAPRLLGDLCGQPVCRFSLPFGKYDRRVLARLRQAGATRVYTSDGGTARDDGWLQARTELGHDIDEDRLETLLTRVATPMYRRAGHWAGRLVRRRRR